ncbi:MAG TPA: metalloregulator ArsR/SmtB family transcription factor [Azoarcus taiwanensis]|uniref:Metalloregulator ArsR/SmtB family transcription factor n=1 Tax=Azoarcus taiwanensis TaxID=666964 RepID=A0A972FGQ8_9RHOO|nr:metalloregulator ArsR/SmtB family transcription factor [Azoarcus taiwanensis]NMG04410.1 metalloregulator ArsR/SmtB family transcription factor [Azoarcus taiwanensis]HRQ57179.1 metalloregulator ArsR/SmtB family transcription factor [Azoarcus taiwanensis]
MNPEHLFKLLSDPTRLRCALLLHRELSLCVCELTEALELSQPKISRHLAMLREGGLVQDERRGQWVHYRLHPSLPGWVVEVLDSARRSDWGELTVNADGRRLAAMTIRPSIERCGA